ncbi:hypothetical protein DN730_03915 [Marinomonas piezotolerans]|uniref:Zorya protein ZorC EH domain-containing protein n=1 Tax=Marinomonas piezotolerans TaxID=2213058 RepID=A0A370UEI2_9GAMM|nr:EH signature domain-containing protein [Marinomonas piezotolerans]RDL46192.1 hypothetical protein DN730_03915 [Marinomonas piezotolerans]
MLQLPSIPKLQDAQWEKVTEEWVKLTANTKKIADGAGQSQEFKALEEGIRRLILNGEFDQVKKVIKKRRGVRVLTQLWIDNEDVRRRSLNDSFIDHIKELHPKLGMSSLMNLIALLYRYFDMLNIDSVFEKLTTWLQGQIDFRLSDRKQPSNTILSSLHQHKNWLFDLSAPKAVVDLAKKNHLDLSDQLKKLRLNDLPQGRFLNICHAQYYLETLKEIPLGESHDILAELSKSEVAKMPYEDGKRIGHIALEIMIDRSGGAPSSIWQNFVLDMAGDPRIANTAKNYREWWQPIGEHRIKMVTSWLAKEDLRLFLGAIEEYGKQSGDDALNRMFPARKKFLEGLYEHGIIRNTRLMLGQSAATTVKKVLGKSMTTSFIKLSDSHMNDKAVIYLDCGEFHIIEGSHQFKLWIYTGLPSSRLSDYSLKSLSHLDLTVGFVRDFNKSYDGNYKAITHSPTTWQKNAIEFLAENGVVLDLEKVLSREDYQVYIRRFGVPVVKKIKSDLSKTLEAQILSVIEINSSIKGKSIVNALLTEFGLVVERSKINSILYSLRSEGKVLLDDGYFWSLPNTNSDHVTHEPTAQQSFDDLSAEGRKILHKIEQLGSCNLFNLRTSLDVTANHCLKYIRGELAPFVEKDFNQMYRLKQK